jgi:hypothetical protein
MDSASTSIDVSGEMEIPGNGGKPAQSPLLPSSSTSPAFSPASFAAAGFANTFVGRKILNGLQTVREIPVVKDATSTGWRNMRSWFDFCNWKRYRKPTLNKLVSKEYYTGRLLRNIQYFHVNYICIFLVLFIYCILTSPLLLIALFLSGGAFYYAHAKNSVRKIAIAGNSYFLQFFPVIFPIILAFETLFKPPECRPYFQNS